jgi:hypothetical protein
VWALATASALVLSGAAATTSDTPNLDRGYQPSSHDDDHPAEQDLQESWD